MFKYNSPKKQNKPGKATTVKPESNKPCSNCEKQYFRTYKVSKTNSNALQLYYLFFSEIRHHKHDYHK